MYFRTAHPPRKCHVAAGSWFAKPDQTLRIIKQGARFVVYSNAAVLFKEALGTSFKQPRKGA